MGQYAKRGTLTTATVSEAIEKGETYEEIATRTGYTLDYVRRIAKKAGYKPRRPLSEDYENIDRLASDGASVSQIAKQLGRNYQSIHDYMVEHQYIVNAKVEDDADKLRLKFEMQREKAKKPPEKIRVKKGQIVKDGRLYNVYRYMWDVTDEILSNDELYYSSMAPR